MPCLPATSVTQWARRRRNAGKQGVRGVSGLLIRRHMRADGRQLRSRPRYLLAHGSRFVRRHRPECSEHGPQNESDSAIGAANLQSNGSARDNQRDATTPPSARSSISSNLYCRCSQHWLPSAQYVKRIPFPVTTVKPTPSTTPWGIALESRSVPSTMGKRILEGLHRAAVEKLRLNFFAYGQSSKRKRSGRP